MPTISIIVPVYNVEKYLHRCLDSILTQTFDNFQLVLVDDGSVDSSGVICDEYAKKDSRIYVFHQKNQGQAVARNFALNWVYENSDSEWICFVDSDDWIHPEMIERLYYAAIEFQKKISVCGWQDTDKEIAWTPLTKFDVKVYNTEEFYCKEPTLGVVPWAKLYHRECFLKMRYPAVRACEDEFITYRVLFQYKDLVVINAPLYAYFMSPNSTMRSNWSPKRLVKIVAQEEQLEFFKNSGYDKAHCYTIKAYLQNFIDQIQEIQKCDKKLQRKYWRFLHRKLRKALSIYKKYYPFQGHEWIYEVAYPRWMCLYWLICAGRNKLRRR